MSEEFHIPYPDQKIFQQGGNQTDYVTQEKQYVQIIEKVEYPESGGIFVYHVNSLFPVKGFPTAEAINAINLVKRFFITQFLVLKTDIKYFVVWAVFLPYKRKIKIFDLWMSHFNRLASNVLDPYILKKERMTPLGQEIHSILSSALKELGVQEGNVIYTSKILSAIIDYDLAYRYRIEDLMSETSKEQMLKSPIREIKRLLNILADRDSTRPHLQEKFNIIGYVVSVLLLFPRFRRVFKKVIKESNFERLQLDEADYYHVLHMKGYKFLGREIEDRWPEYVAMHKGAMPTTYILEKGVATPMTV